MPSSVPVTQLLQPSAHLPFHNPLFFPRVKSLSWFVSLSNVSHSVPLLSLIIPFSIAYIPRMSETIWWLSFSDWLTSLSIIPSKKLFPYCRSSRFSPISTSRSFIVLHFIFRSIAHFELIFVNGVRSVSRFIFYMWISSCSKHHLLKRLSLFQCIIAYAPLSNIGWPYSCGSIMGFFILFHWSVFLVFYQCHHCLDYYSFIVKSWGWVVSAFQPNSSIFSWLFWIFYFFI